MVLVWVVRLVLVSIGRVLGTFVRLLAKFRPGFVMLFGDSEAKSKKKDDEIDTKRVSEDAALSIGFCFGVLLTILVMFGLMGRQREDGGGYMPLEMMRQDVSKFDAAMELRNVLSLLQLNEDLHVRMVQMLKGKKEEEQQEEGRQPLLVEAMKTSLEPRFMKVKSQLQGVFDALAQETNSGGCPALSNSVKESGHNIVVLLSRLKMGILGDIRNAYESDKSSWETIGVKYENTLRHINQAILDVAKSIAVGKPMKDKKKLAELREQHFIFHHNGATKISDGHVVSVSNLVSRPGKSHALSLFFKKALDAALNVELLNICKKCVKTVSSLEDLGSCDDLDLSSCGESDQDLIVDAIGLNVQDDTDRRCVVLEMLRFMLLGRDKIVELSKRFKEDRNDHDVLEKLKVLVLKENVVPRTWLIPIE